MDVLFLATLIATGVFVLNAKQQRERVALLASYLGNYQIEKLMENLTEGYLRALGESDAERREQVWNLLRTTELQLSEQFTRFTADFTRVEPLQTRISTLPLALPYADRWLPSASIDMRQDSNDHLLRHGSPLIASPSHATTGILVPHWMIQFTGRRAKRALSPDRAHRPALPRGDFRRFAPCESRHLLFCLPWLI